MDPFAMIRDLAGASIGSREVAVLGRKTKSRRSDQIRNNIFMSNTYNRIERLATMGLMLAGLGKLLCT
ncbi:hypothetical protein Pyn_26148 [Prunus yedoensis var. nudiflora]|uniref:Uncharacterized protein n=1 Tax=Prunus yedoensis var. nudiflora TaxID=2094558 RepID=A0A314Y596_PRUYE|nr:hypothetical protein Pyn_26148 [Prunus yedoensis var. nudiflora]